MNHIPSIIHESWHKHLSDVFLHDEGLIKLNTEILPYQQFYPERQNIFTVFQMPMDKIKVVILGQDPYPNFAQANGLAFAVNEHIKMPKSLEIIQRELNNEELYQEDKYADPRQWKTLIPWWHQGVFLFNTALTVEANNIGSHITYWENFCNTVIKAIATEHMPIWLLWGARAKSYRKLIQSCEVFCVNDILEAAHPASESYPNSKGGFYGCGHFLKANELLIEKGQQAINW